VRIFKNAWFERFAHKQKIPAAMLREAVQRAEQGLIDADLGGGVIKQRVARSGQDLNVSKNLISDWERGVKRPGGPALRLLTVIEKKGLQSIA
jgi:hypothetical protein